MRTLLLGPWVLAILLLVGVKPKAPKRPTTVPAEGVWVGDKEGGQFIHIGARTVLGWQVKVFGDRDGLVKAEGEFRIMGLARAEVQPQELVKYDGRAIHLSDGAHLVPVAK